MAMYIEYAVICVGLAGSGQSTSETWRAISPIAHLLDHLMNLEISNSNRCTSVQRCFYSFDRKRYSYNNNGKYLL